MYKIFIDTNWFFDFYRTKAKDKIVEMKPIFKKYKKYFVNTEQSRDEFYRNRVRIISEFEENLKKQINSINDNSFLYDLVEYEDYKNNIIDANNKINKMLMKCTKVRDNVEENPIAKMYSDYNALCLESPDDIVLKAEIRKARGNPPSSNKNTCCDEIIWETLLKNLKSDLIIVSGDETFTSNYAFLKDEYKRVVGKDLIVVKQLYEAIKVLGDLPSPELEDIETVISIDKEVDDFINNLSDSSWVSIVYKSLRELGGVATLNDLYEKVNEMILSQYPEKASNKNIEATVRGVLQYFCGKSSSFKNKMDLFENIKPGVWGIKKNEEM